MNWFWKVNDRLLDLLEGERERLRDESYLIRSNFIKTTYDISLDSQISFLPLGFSPTKEIMERNRETPGAQRNKKLLLGIGDDVNNLIFRVS